MLFYYLLTFSEASFDISIYYIRRFSCGEWYVLDKEIILYGIKIYKNIFNAYEYRRLMIEPTGIPPKDIYLYKTYI